MSSCSGSDICHNTGRSLFQRSTMARAMEPFDNFINEMT